MKFIIWEIMDMHLRLIWNSSKNLKNVRNMKIGNEMKTYKKIIAGVTGIFIGVVQGISVNVIAAEVNVQPDAPVVQVSNLQNSYEQMKQDLEKKLQEFKTEGKVIEARAYNTVYGVWTYFTADDGQIELWQYDYLVIGTIESYYALKEYFGDDVMVPLYIEVEDGLRLSRALERERAQTKPQYAELCRRFLADAEDFSEENLERAGIKRRFQNIDKETCMEEILREINVNL